MHRLRMGPRVRTGTVLLLVGVLALGTGIGGGIGAAILTGMPGLAVAEPLSAAGFSDVQGHWAEKYIEQMAVKGAVRGYGDGGFRPDERVSRLEVVVMLVRVLGLDAQAQAVSTIPSSFRRPELVPSWGRGYVAVAVNQGVIAGDDLLDFRGNDDASRLEVARLAVRALGMGDEAERLSGTWLSYADANLIPSAAKGYVAVASEEGIMTGLPNGRFDPDGNVTRAQMAAIMARLDDRLQNALDASEVSGTLAVLSLTAARSISVTRADGTVKVVPVASSCSVYRDSTRVSLSQLAVGDPVRAILDAAGRAVFIDNAAVAAVAESSLTATLVAAVTGTTPLVTVEDARGDRKTYSVAAGCDIERDGEDVTLAGLRSGDKLTLTLRGSAVTRIKAESQDFEVDGEFVRVDYTNPPTITLKVDGEQKTYPLDVDATVKRNDRTSTLGALRAGDQVTLTVRKGEVTRITAEVTEESVEGTVQTITIGQIPEIAIRTTDGEEKTYPVSSRAVIRKGRTRIELYEVKPGSYVEADIESGEVTRMQVEPYTVLDDLKGIVEYVVESADVIVMSPVSDASGTGGSGGVGSGPTQIREIHVTADTVFLRGDRVIDLEDIEPGDRIIAVGSRATGIFVAQAIVVLTVHE